MEEDEEEALESDEDVVLEDADYEEYYNRIEEERKFDLIQGEEEEK